MRELSFKGYLQQQLCELSNYDSKSLYKFAGLAVSNAKNAFSFSIAVITI